MLHITEAMHRCQIPMLHFIKKVEICSLLKKDWLKGLKRGERFLYIIFCLATAFKNLVQFYSEKMIESLKTET